MMLLKNRSYYKFQIENVFNRFDQIAEQLGHKLNFFTNDSLDNLVGLDQDYLDQLIHSLQSYINILSTVESKRHQDVKEDEQSNFEIEMLKEAFFQFGIGFDDDDFDFIGPDDIVEVYNFEGIQLYRSLSLLKLNVYDLATLLTKKWSELYHRPKKIEEQILNKINEIKMIDFFGASRFDIPEHLLVAKGESELAIAKINLKYIKPVFNLKKDKKIGFICTQTCSEIVARENDGIENISMIRERAL